MCILCALQRGSRRAIGMLPWLVIPLVLLWGMSQILPPGLRFEVTSPRLACVAVLLGTIFWYEILLPLLSAYRARRCARAREQQLSIAAEVIKLRKTAIRRCRNCLAAYRDQNPFSGKFMCSSCGHLSKRPILDLHGHPGTRNPGFLSSFFSKNTWFLKLGCSAQDGGSWDEHWGQERVAVDESFAQGRVSSIFSFFSAVFGKIFEAGSSDSKRGRSIKVTENVVQESKGEKARRKAEERRLARLEKQMLEEEERRQREEVVRLIEERRRLREGVKMEDDYKEGMNSIGFDCSKERRKDEPDKRRRGRRREKDVSSTKSSTSDGEDHEHVRLASPCKIKSNLTVVACQKFKLHDVGRGASYSPTGLSKGWNAFSKDSHSGLVSLGKSNRPIAGFMNKAQSVGKTLSISDTEMPKQTLPRAVAVVPPPITTPGKSWRQLFARPSLRTFPVEDVVCKGQMNESDEKYSDNLARGSTQEKEELFQDPCFEPDRDKGDYMPNFLPSIRKECNSALAKKPSPIESPLSRSSSSREDQSALPEVASDTGSDQGTWQMWSSSLCKDGLDLVGGPASWLSALEQSKVAQQEMPQSPIESSDKASENVYGGMLMDDRMVIQLMADHHPCAGRVAVPLNPFPGDVRSHLAYVGFRGSVSQKEESCFRPNGYAHQL